MYATKVVVIDGKWVEVRRDLRHGLLPCKSRDHLIVDEVKLLTVPIEAMLPNPKTGQLELTKTRSKIGVCITTRDGTRWVRHKKGNWSVRHEGETKTTPIGNGRALMRVYPAMADILINAYRGWLIDNPQPWVDAKPTVNWCK